MNAAEDIYPWQHEAWRQFLDGVARDRLGHALLITGAAGVGLEWFAACQCRHLLALARRDRPGSEQLHPDLMWVRKEHPSAGNNLTRPRANILIEQIRALSEYLQHRPTGKHKVAVVELIEECNEQAANALLKSLEEPAAGSHVILLSHAPGRVPATIRSRCVQLKINLPDAQTTQAWLADFPAPQAAWALWLTAGAPVVSARLLTEDVIATFMALDEELADMLDARQLSWPLIKKLAKQSQDLVNTFLLRVLLAASGLAQGVGGLAPEVKVHSVRSLAPAATEGKKPAAKERPRPVLGKEPRPVLGEKLAPAAKEGRQAAAKEGRAPAAKEGRAPAAKERPRPVLGEELAPAAKEGRQAAAKEGKQPFGKLPYGLLLQDCLAKRRHIYELVNINHELLLANQFAGWLDVLKR